MAIEQKKTCLSCEHFKVSDTDIVLCHKDLFEPFDYRKNWGVAYPLVISLAVICPEYTVWK